MSPITHGLIGWIVANSSPKLNPKERGIITLAALVPDLDGLGIIMQYITQDSDHQATWYFDYHHTFGHNLFFGIFLMGVAWMVTEKRGVAALLTGLSYHLHLLGDLVGSRGTHVDDKWPIPYLFPISDEWTWNWSGQWQLVSWQNFTATALTLGITFHLAWRRGYSPLELISNRADQAFVTTLRKRFPASG
ncbi:MAG: metal-dependent hydrolase [Magnetococcales bacterium]|nr:metal-dependent hydrolase [Magnetococcales bacterium]